MSTTTQILFNSPALHSLKRDQLVRLCKVHSLKANGKNVELIQRLRQHAKTLPNDSPLSVAARSEDSETIPSQSIINTSEDDQGLTASVQEQDVFSFQNTRPRPSEQWEVVMDSIEEVEENSSQGTMTSQRTVKGGTGEFGTGGSKSTTVSSSIRALASSLGLKRTMTKSTSASTSSKFSATSRSSQPHTLDDLSQNSKPYSDLPLPNSPPQTDHFVLDTGRPSLSNTEDSPLPGHVLRPGVPAPPNARLSLGLGLGVPATPSRRAQPTTTIRLVSNPLAQQDYDMNTSSGVGENGTPQLQPFQTTFDITFGSPIPGPFNFGFSGLTSWPPNAAEEDEKMGGIYPKLTLEDLGCSPSRPRREEAERIIDDDVDMPGSLPRPCASEPSRNLAVAAEPIPFIFGSPNHKTSNAEFRNAAASVLEEMNARLRAEGVDEISANIVNKLHPNRKSPPVQPREIKPIPISKRGEITSKFDAAHEQDFNRMEGIDVTHKKRQQHRRDLSPQKGGGNEQENHREKAVQGKKRKSSVLESDVHPHRPSTLPNKPVSTRVISNGRRAKAIPGGFDMEEDEDERAPNDERVGKRVRVDPESLTPEELKKKAKEEQQEIELEKEKEAIKKKLEANRARRRSSAVAGRKSVGGAAGRKSIGRNGARPSISMKQKPKPSRFGFLSSAKSLVQSVWNRGKAQGPPPSNIPKPTTTVTAVRPEHIPATKQEKDANKLGQPSVVSNSKSVLAPAKPTTACASGSVAGLSSARLGTAKLSAQISTAQAHPQGSIASTSRSRSPIPSFGEVPPMVASSSSAGSGSGRQSLWSAGSRQNSIIVGSGKSRTSAVAVSSIGTRLSGIRASNTGSGTIGSMGVKKGVVSASRTSSMGTAASTSSSSRVPTRSSTSSRFLAPTASSLAKTARQSSAVLSSSSPASELKKIIKDKEDQIDKTALGSITNNSAVHRKETMLPPSVIFSKPLLLPNQRKNAGDFSSNAASSIVDAQVKRTLSGRKPRISRSKVIARLASQRAASGNSISSSRSSSSELSSGAGGLQSQASGVVVGSGRTRSSLGVKVSRASYGSAGGLKSRASGGNGVALAMSAKRRARQSEYLRRKSNKVVSAEGDKMEVDPNV